MPTHNRTPPERGRNQGAGGSSSAGPSSRSGSLGRSPQNQGGVGPGQVGLGKSPPVRGTPARRGSKKGHRLTADDWDDADEEIRDYFAGVSECDMFSGRSWFLARSEMVLMVRPDLKMQISLRNPSCHTDSSPDCPGPSEAVFLIL